MELTREQEGIIHSFQRNELTEYLIYKKLAAHTKSQENSQVLSQIAEDEQRHAIIWGKYLKKQATPNMFKVKLFYWIFKLFGITFAIKLMERGEENAQDSYSTIDNIPEAATIQKEENIHEKALIDMIDEEHLKYMGSIVLGLNDALVELTGVLAGLTLALRDPKLIALTGAVTGIAAALSMAASEYLSTKSEETDKHAGKASIYTGIAYIFTVIALVSPFLVFSDIYFSLAQTFIAAVLIVAAFNYYISIVKEVNFKRRFLEMIGICFGVGALSFLIGYILRIFFGVDA
ncbi:VIT1/CCC1 transporter family protein [Saccharicrinis sp. FJH62]|uniref:VIT1/CCC1 transporter family protein n=1 Tax=Saccharicrinis sp. FJH62 TaxID=3344657 RepID=UPI0035D4FBF8